MITIIVITTCVQLCPLYHFELVIFTTTSVPSLCRKTKLYFKRDAVLRSELHLNFSKSARACNVSFCFDFYLNDTWHVFFSVALSHRGRRRHPGNIWVFFHVLSMHFVINFVKIIKHLYCTAFSNFLYLNMHNLVKQARENLQRILNAETVL